MEYTTSLRAHLQAVEEALPRFLPEAVADYRPVPEAMAYSCAVGGKRLRPVLLLEWCRVCHGDTTRALPFACALEMIHSYSLVHDDLPCMDDSPLRRGKPSVHKAYGEAMALLTGDALLNRAFETVLSPCAREGLPAAATADAAFTLAQAAGIGGMIGGQVMDLRLEGQPIDMDTLVTLQAGKTAALIMAACRMGAQLAGASADVLQAADVFGRELGLCFQIVDDILDATATEESMGKPVGSDVQNQKNTYVSLLGVEGARALAAHRTQAALEALDVFGAEADELRALTRALLVREN